MKNRMRIIFIIAMAFASLPTSARGYFSASNTIHDMVVDGPYIWCATDGGVVRWDTRDMSVARYTASDGLADTVVHAIGIAPDGTVWAGSRNGLSRYTENAWSTHSESGWKGSVTSLAIAPDGTVWAGADSSGVYAVNGTTTRKYTTADGLPSDTIGHVAVDSDGSIWVSAVNQPKVSRFSGESWTIHTFGEDNPDERIKALAADSHGGVWVGLDSCAMYFDGTSWIRYRDWLPINQFSKIVCAAVAGDGAPWFGFIGGFKVLRYDGKQMPHYYLNAQPSAIAFDAEGTVWAGTLGDGLHRLRENGWWQYLYPEDPAKCSVSVLTTEPDDVLWVGTKYGLVRYKGSEWKPVYLQDNKPSTQMGPLCVAPDGIIWAGMLGKIGRFDGRDWQEFVIPDTSAVNTHVSTLTLAPDGALWVGLIGRKKVSGVGRWVGRGLHRFKDYTWKSYTESDGLTDTHVTSLITGKDGTIWAGTFNGIFRFTGEVWESRHPSEWWSPEVYDMDVTPDGTIYAGGIFGLYAYRDGTWESCIDDPYEEIYVNSFAVDASGRIWIDWLPGVICLDGDRMTRYVTGDNDADAGHKTITAGPNGEIFFGTYNGLYQLGGSQKYRPLIEYGVSAVSDRWQALPEAFTVSNYPNPFNPSTTITFSLPKAGQVSLAVYDATGRKVAELAKGFYHAGHQSITWDAKDCASGVYFCTLRAGERVETKKMLLVR